MNIIVKLCLAKIQITELFILKFLTLKAKYFALGKTKKQKKYIYIVWVTTVDLFTL